VRAPDVAFLRAERLVPGVVTDKFIRLAPDLAVEVFSPGTRRSTMDEKLSEYRAAGTTLIWFVDPKRRGVTVFDGDAPARWAGDDDEIDGGAIVEGRRVPER
jgi:Uma2 family endonuclease